MKRKLITLSGWILFIALFIVVIITNTNDKTILVNSTNKNNSDTLSMMYETEFGTGEYIVSSSLNWPDSQSYSFNPRLSKCENGGTLSWDSTTNQVIMTGDKSDKCYVYFDIAPYHVTCSDNTLACQIAKKYTSDGVNNLYYHDGYGDYTNSDLEAGDYSYRYAGGDYKVATAYQSSYSSVEDIVQYVLDSDGYVDHWQLAYDTSKTFTFLGQAFRQAQVDGYLEESVNNYVCFGSIASTCPDENLYRIIGVFKNTDGTYSVKLISADLASVTMLGDSSVSSDYLGSASSTDHFYTGKSFSTSNTGIRFASYNWNNENYTTAYEATGYYNVWEYSSLNAKHLNDYYLNTYIGSTWSSKISNHTWVVGGADFQTNSSAKEVYSLEMLNPYSDNLIKATYDAKVGLIYVSDYMYAKSDYYWNNRADGIDTDGTTNIYLYNWLYIGTSFGDYTITRCVSSKNVYIVSSEAFHNWWIRSFPSCVRVTFYLNSNVTLSSGTGSSSDPYRIN